MRRQWYLGFGIILLFTLLTSLLITGGWQWFTGILVLLLGIWLYDITQTKHSILRNFPVLGHMRYILEFFRPELQQYFIANDQEERPFNREIRTLVYERAKGICDTLPFGTVHDISSVGYTWILHSLDPKPYEHVLPRISVGGDECTKPYMASRLNISAMSFGALSAHAIMALNKGAKIGDFAHNTGEGGLSPYHLQGGDIIFQIGTAYFGCRSEDGSFNPDLFKECVIRDEVKMIEVKLSQGAKPSHGGILPAAKLTSEIASIRKVALGQDVISPPAHTAFNTPKGLLRFIQELRKLSGGKPVGFKLCIGRRDEFLSICKAMIETNILPDFITVDGAEGGTGAAPLEFSNRIGEESETALIFVHNALVGINMRDKIRIICSGKVATGFDMVFKLALGADMCNSARAMMMATGCVQSRQCNANTCPTGVATQNKRLQRGLVVDQKKHRVASYHKHTMESFLEIVAAMGLTDPSDLKPEYIMRRVSPEKVKSLKEMYHFLEPGELLGEKIPEDFKHYWDEASSDKF